MRDLPMTAPPKSSTTFTVFTATYNRAHTLHRVYESLCRQTFRDFEWLIVDDGSADESAALIAGWTHDADFPIRYLRQENQGKHIAFNRGVDEARGEFFLYFDSDDACVPEALERFLHAWQTIPEQERPQFAGVCCRCLDEDGHLVGDKYPADSFDANYLEIEYRYKVRGEAWLLHRTDILASFPFPATVTQCCIPETVVWHKIARRYRMRFINDPLRIYFQGAGGQLTRLTQKQRMKGRVVYAHPLFQEIDWFRYAPVYFLKKALQYALLCTLARESLGTQYRRLPNVTARLLWLVSILPAVLLAKCQR